MRVLRRVRQPLGAHHLLESRSEAAWGPQGSSAVTAVLTALCNGRPSRAALSITPFPPSEPVSGHTPPQNDSLLSLSCLYPVGPRKAGGHCLQQAGGCRDHPQFPLSPLSPPPAALRELLTQPTASPCGPPRLSPSPGVGQPGIAICGVICGVQGVRAHTEGLRPPVMKLSSPTAAPTRPPSPPPHPSAILPPATRYSLAGDSGPAERGCELPCGLPASPAAQRAALQSQHVDVRAQHGLSESQRWRDAQPTAPCSPGSRGCCFRGLSAPRPPRCCRAGRVLPSSSCAVGLRAAWGQPAAQHTVPGFVVRVLCTLPPGWNSLLSPTLDWASSELGKSCAGSKLEA